MLQLRIESIKWELPDVATFFLKDVSGRKISYKAGQFVTLVFTHKTEEIRRSYSLSSSPDEDLLAVTVKRQANGEISRYMLTKLSAGDILTAVEPAGRFVVHNFHPEKDIFFFAAGSGITPVFSQLKYLLQRDGKSKLTLIYSSNNTAVLFKKELDSLAAEHPDRLNIIYLISNQGKRLNNTTTEQLVKQNLQFSLDKSEFFVCGPFPYMRMVRLTLIYIGVDPGKIRRENFVIETVSVAHTSVYYPPGRVKIYFNGEVYDITTGENQSILQAALQNNIQLPYSCRVGSCSTCTAICKSGKVGMSINEVLTDDDLKQGWILTCTGHPVSEDVVIEYPKSDL
ncbi:MAG: ferredoxin--NADP reductase [Bacteroidetes bacterium]|nr:ferredoxin--NADP reductase [Bacteroidota bacterium]